MPPKALYVHIPFCSSKCFYCDFNSFVSSDAVRAAYVRALLVEISMLHDEQFGVHARPKLETIFFGGGTPTLLTSSEFTEVAKHIHALYDIGDETEWTVEANPGSVDRQKLSALWENGVNRLSFGAQTFNETLLQVIGRLHDAHDVEHSVHAAIEQGFTRINLDLMLGLPEQTLADVEESLHRALQTGVSHISAYGLKVEENTPFYKWQKEGLLHLPQEEAEVEMYEYVRAYLRDEGFAQYEISNFSKPFDEARHNLMYWENRSYLAVGAGAHGYTGNQRYENERSLSAYSEVIRQGKRPVASTHRVSATEAMEDTMMLGLRLQQGVERKRFFSFHGQELDAVFGSLLTTLCERGWIAQNNERVWIPPQYDEVANEIFSLFVGYL